MRQKVIRGFIHLCSLVCRRRLAATILFFVCLIPAGRGAEIDWTAYNDCIEASGGNATAFTNYRDYTGATSGVLMDYSTGSTVGMPTVTFTIPANPEIQPDAHLDYGSVPLPGTDAYEIFNNKINFSGTIIEMPPDCGEECWFVDIQFTNLDSNKKYTFVGSAFRNREYTDERQSRCTILGADAFTNNSSDGVDYKAGNVTIFQAADNSNEGYVVRWDDIEPGADGQFSVYTVSADPGGRRGYPLHGFMLMQIDDNANDPPVVSAGTDRTIHLPRQYLTLTGSVSDDGQGIPNGFLESTWSQLSGPDTVEFITDVNQIEITACFPQTGAYELQLSATDGELNSDDEVIITVAEAVCPVGDVNGDCVVTLIDLGLIGLNWLDDTGSIADLDGDRQVRMQELNLLGQSWLDDWTGSLQVSISPAEAVAAGAKWRVDGGVWRSSGAVVSSLGEGSHDVEYSVVSGWTSPGLQTIQVTRQQTTFTSGEYKTPPKTLSIGEFMAINSNVYDLRPVPAVNIYTQIDGLRAYDDWIELKNMTDETVNLEGWYLTDDPDNLTKWQFPAGYSIPAQGHFVVWASNKDIAKYGYPFIDDLGNLHTNFDLSIGGEYLALVWPDGQSIEYAYNDYPKQRGLVSYGFASGDPNNIGYMTSPTLSTTNADIYDGVVADTQFSVDRGFYDSPFTVEISCETPGAEIRYTTDNSEPTETNGTVYTGPISIDRSTCLRAAAFKSGCLSSNVDTQSYIFLDDVLDQATNPSTGGQVTPAGYPTSWGSVTGDYQVDPDIADPSGMFGSLYAATLKDDLKAIPSISIVVPIDQLFGATGIYINQSQDGTERAGSVEFIDPTGVEKFHTNCGVRMQGGASDVAGGTTLDRWKSYKLSFRLTFRGIFGGQLEYPLFGDEGTDVYNTIVLDSRPQNSWVHATTIQRVRGEYVRDQVAADTQLALGGFAPHGRPVHLYLNGLYWGLYWMHERPDGAFAASYLGGDKEDYDVIKHVWNNAIDGSYDDYVATFSISAASPNAVTAFENLWQKLDVTDCIDYLITNYYIGNGDWDHKNWYATHNRFNPAGRWRWHMWDGEHIMDDGSFSTTDVTAKNNYRAPTGLHQAWISNSEYRMLFADRVHKHFFHDGALTPGNFAGLFTHLTDWIDRAIIGESARWGDNRDGTPRTRNIDWLNEVNRLGTSFIPTRRNVVLAQFTSKNPAWYPSTAAPELYVNSSAQYGGDVASGSILTMSNGGNTIYYTLDGSDPRLPGGAVNTTSAVAYSSAITLTKATYVKVRAYSGGEWSALSEAVFNTDLIADSLRNTEIMYHPADPNLEFIELQNISTTQSINLNWVRFTKGIDHTFGDVNVNAGGYVLLVRNQSIFESHYTGIPAGVQVIQWDLGSLDNDGDKIQINDALGRTIQLFNYKDGWYPLTDGLGFSLTIRDPLQDPLLWDKKAGWRASLYAGGTPGKAGLAVLAPGSIVINEILSHSHDPDPQNPTPDWIELHNTTGQDINIGGWFLSDNNSDDPNLMKYVIPANTVIKANGSANNEDYMVFVQDVGQQGSDYFPFGLSEAGETVYLTSGEDGQITGYYQTEENFDTSETDVTFGRYEKAELSGGYDFTRMALPTQGYANSGPLISDIVFTEIHYNPPAGGAYEFVELYNRSGLPVTLMSPADRYTSPTTFVTENIPWRLEGTGYEFPMNTVLGAGEYLIVAKDPTLSVYNGLPNVYGPYDGALDNGGEQIEIQIPGDWEYGELSRYWIPIEKIDYDDAAPWVTTPDGGGDSLQRINVNTYGRDYSNWQAGTPGPGQ